VTNSDYAVVIYQKPLYARVSGPRVTTWLQPRCLQQNTSGRRGSPYTTSSGHGGHEGHYL